MRTVDTDVGFAFVQIDTVNGSDDGVLQHIDHQRFALQGQILVGVIRSVLQTQNSIYTHDYCEQDTGADSYLMIHD